MMKALKIAKFLYAISGPKTLALACVILAALFYSLFQLGKRYGRSRGVLIFGLSVLFGIGLLNYFVFYNLDLAHILTTRFGGNNLVPICIALFSISALLIRAEGLLSKIGKTELASRLAPSRKIRYGIAGVIVALVVTVCVANDADLVTNMPGKKGDYQVSKLSSEKRALVLSSYKDLQSAFAKKDYAQAVNKADQILTILPQGYHYTSEYRIDALRFETRAIGSVQTSNSKAKRNPAH